MQSAELRGMGSSCALTSAATGARRRAFARHGARARVRVGCAVKRQHPVGQSATGSMLPLNCARPRITAAFAGRGRPWTKAHASRSRGLTKCGRFDRSLKLASLNQGHLALHFVLPFNVKSFASVLVIIAAQEGLGAYSGEVERRF